MNRNHVMGWIDIASRLLLAGVFAYAAWSKIQDPALFADVIAKYRLGLPRPVTDFVALTLPGVELLAAGVLVFAVWSREAALLLAGLLVVFVVGLTQAWARGLEIDCGCFGPSDPERPAPLWLDILRDLALMLPAGWLLVRPNGWLWTRLRAGAVMVALLGVSFAASADTNAVETGRWTADFTAAKAAAEAEHRPLITVVKNTDCPYCLRFETAVGGAAFRNWIADAPIYLVETYADQTNKLPSAAAALAFVKSAKPEIAGLFPYVGVYWPRENGTALNTAFTGRRDKMPGEHGGTLSRELTTALNDILKEYLQGIKDRRYLDDEAIGGYEIKTVKVRTMGSGTVAMSPESGVMKGPKDKIALTATPAEGWTFSCWRTPDSIFGKYKDPQMTLDYDRPGGTYVAVFKRKAK